MAEWWEQDEVISEAETWWEDDAVAVEIEPRLPDEIYERAGKVWDASQYWELPLEYVERHYEALSDLQVATVTEFPINLEGVKSATISQRLWKGFVRKFLSGPLHTIISKGGIGKTDTILRMMEQSQKAAEKAEASPLQEVKIDNPFDILRPSVLKQIKKATAPQQARTDGAVAKALGMKHVAVPAAETIPEKATEIVTGVGAFILRLAALGKLLGVPRGDFAGSVVVWETDNIVTGGVPGTGAAMRLALGGIDAIPAATMIGKTAKVGSQSSLFAGIAYAAGGEWDDVAMAALIPLAFKSWTAAARGIAKGRAARAIKNLRAESDRYGINLKNVPDKSLDAIINASKQASFWNKQYAKGKITAEIQDFRLNQIKNNMKPILNAIAKQQPKRPTAKPPAEKAIVKPEKPAVAITKPKPAVVAPAEAKPAPEGAKTAFVSKNPKEGELPWRVNVLDEQGRPLYHTDHATEREAFARLGALERIGEVQARPPAEAKPAGKEPWEMTWEEAEKIYVQGKLAKSAEWKKALRDYDAAVETAETNTIKSKQRQLDLDVKKAARKAQQIDKDADVEIAKLLRKSKTSPEARAKLEEYKGEKWAQEALARPPAEAKPAIGKKFYTSVPEEWRKHKQLADWGTKGLRTKDNLKVGKRKTFVWQDEFEEIPTRLPKSTMDAFRAKTDEIWLVTTRKKGVENHYLIPKQVVADVRAELGEKAFERRPKPVPTPRQILTYAIQSANIRGDVHPGEIIERALADKEIGITEAGLSDKQKRVLEEYRRDYDRERQAVLRDIQAGAIEKVPIAEEEIEERIAIQEEKIAGEIGDFLEGIVEEKPTPTKKPRPQDLLGRPILEGGAIGKQLDFDLKIYVDKVPPTDIPSKVALQDAVAQALNRDYQKIRATKKKYKGIKDEKALYEKEFKDKPELFIRPEKPLPEMRAAWTIATRGKGLFGGKTTSQVIQDAKKPIDHREGGFIEIPPITTVGQIEAEHPNIRVVPPKKDIGLLQKWILTATNQAQNSGHPTVIEAAEEMADTGMVIWNETRSQLITDQHLYKQLPKDYRANDGAKFFDLMDKHYDPEEIARAIDIPDEVKPILQHFKEQDELMRQEIIKQKRQMATAVLMRKNKAALQEEARNAGIETTYETVDKHGDEVRKEKTKAMLSAELVEMVYVTDDWGRAWSHIQHIFFGQYELQWIEIDPETGKRITHFIGRAENQTEAYKKLADWKVAREAAGFDDADRVRLVATPELHLPFDVLRISRKHFYTLEKQIQEAADMQRNEIDDALRGIIGKRESKQKWWGAMMHRKGAPGYSQDFWRVWTVQTSQFNRWKHLSAMNRKVEPLIEQVRAEGLRGWAQYLEDTKDLMWGRKRRDGARGLDDWLSKTPVVRNYVRPFALERWAGWIKSVNYWRHLQTGRFYIINSLQPIQTLWPVVGEKGLYRGFKLYYSKEGQDLLRRHKVAGISGKLHEIGMKRARRFERYLPAGASEIRNQAVAFLALYDDAIKRGMTDADAARYARLRGQLFTQFTYTAADIPKAMRGPIGGLIFQYKRFSIKNLELVSRLAREGKWGGVGRWLAALLSIGGLNTFLKVLPVGVAGYLTYKLYNQIKEAYGKEVADVIHHGLPGLIGIDLSGSVTPIDVPYGDNIYEKVGNIVFGPTGTTAVKLINDVTNLKVAKDIGLVPRALKSVVDSSPTVKQFVFLVKALWKDTTNYDAKQRALYVLEVWDLWKKAFGFRAETETIQRMQFEAMMSLKQEYDETIDHIILAVIENDSETAAKHIQEWQTNYPEAPLTSEAIMRRIQERSLARQLPVTIRGLEQMPEPLRGLFVEKTKSPKK